MDGKMECRHLPIFLPISALQFSPVPFCPFFSAHTINFCLPPLFFGIEGKKREPKLCFFTLFLEGASFFNSTCPSNILREKKK